ncbi:uncharacterized protein A4U43_C02F15470 [Asparagus officinalis]|uniref:Uncharacterized protein n=1 Tax=Asparagus officinalis TaxID=4686 RepID=A0A5P1FMI7_ASPOF|nr:uncharacterized protein A4U43_C02F15470 [Asparagus officinalis]
MQWTDVVTSIIQPPMIFHLSRLLFSLFRIPRHRSLTELRRQAVTREMSWRLTEEHESVHCCYITHQAASGSSRSHIVGLRPGVLGLDAPPRNEFLASASTLKNRLTDLGWELPVARHRFYG